MILCKHPGCPYPREPNIDYCRGHEGGFTIDDLGRTAMDRRATFPADSASRKAIPIVRGFLNYFPAAAAAVARVSFKGNEKHNPGQPLHHARGKSTDHLDSSVRHIMEFEENSDAVDLDSGESVLAHAAWRVLAKLQEHLESKGAPLACGARLPEVKHGKTE